MSAGLPEANHKYSNVELPSENIIGKESVGDQEKNAAERSDEVAADIVRPSVRAPWIAGSAQEKRVFKRQNGRNGDNDRDVPRDAHN